MIALISDLHSNLEAVETVFEDIESKGIERVVCLGDVIGYGANPREVLSLVIDRCAFTIMGNHEQALMYEASDFSDRARAAIEWTRSVLNSTEFPREENHRFWDFLGKLPESRNEKGMLFVHGSPRDPVREYMMPSDGRNAQKMKSVFKVQNEPICFVGHSHVPGVFSERGGFQSPRNLEGSYAVPSEEKVLVNVGSVGQPRDGDPRSSYATFDGSKVFFHRLKYDNKKASEKILAIPELPKFLGERLLVGK